MKDGISQNYQVMPELSETDFEALKADIAERGVMVPVEYDEDGNILDGHHRVKACQELGEDWPSLTRKGFSEEEKRTHARRINIARRHLNQEQKRELILGQLIDTPEQSNRQIARGLGVSDNTVRVVREEGEATAQIAQLNKTIGADGKKRRKPIRTTYKESHAKKAHVSNNSGNNEWYTPAYIIEAAREVLGQIELDPATSDIANITVRASEFYTEADDALSLDWPPSKIWMNPPYARGMVEAFAAKLVDAVNGGAEAIALVNNASETGWFQSLAERCSSVCFHRGRVRYSTPDGDSSGTPLQGQAIFYFGPETRKFVEQFKQYGVVLCNQP